MEKYHTIVKIERLRKELGQGEFDRAFDTALRINIDKLKSMSDLSLVAEAYVHAGRFKKARKLYLYIYERTNSKRILSKLVHVNLKLKDIEAANKYLTEYDKVAPEDFYRLIFRYNLYKLQGKNLQECIPILVALKDKEYIDYWVYELAKLYHKAGESEKCVSECDEIILWFGEGEYVEKARALKTYYNQGIKKIFAGEEARNLAAKLNTAMKKTSYKNHDENNVLEEGELEKEAGTKRLWTVDNEEADEKTAEGMTEEGMTEEGITAEGMTARGWIVGTSTADVSEEFNNSMEDKEELSEDDLISAITKNIESVVDEMSKKIAIPQSFERKKVNKNNKTGKKENLEYNRNLKDDVAEYTVATEEETNAEIKSVSSNKNLEYAIEDTEKAETADDIEASSIVIESTDNKAIEVLLEELEQAGGAGQIDEAKSGKLELTDDDLFTYPVFNEPSYEYSSTLAENLSNNEISLEEIYESYFHKDSIKKQIIKSLSEYINRQNKVAGIVITDEMNYGYGRRLLAKRMAKALCRMKAIQSNKAAIINADKINNMYLPQKKSQLINCCVIIEDAAKLSYESMLGIKELYRECNENIMFILEGPKSVINRKLKKDMIINNMFHNRINIHEYGIDDWKQYIYEQFENQDYEISMKAEAMLSQKISKIMEEGGDCFEKITVYTEKCIKNSEKRSGGLLLKLSTELKLGSAQLMVIRSEDLE